MATTPAKKVARKAGGKVGGSKKGRVQRIQTDAGVKKYGEPKGTIITADLEAKAKKRAAAKATLGPSGAAKAAPSPGGPKTGTPAPPPGAKAVLPGKKPLAPAGVSTTPKATIPAKKVAAKKAPAKKAAAKKTASGPLYKQFAVGNTVTIRSGKTEWEVTEVTQTGVTVKRVGAGGKIYTQSFKRARMKELTVNTGKGAPTSQKKIPLKKSGPKEAPAPAPKAPPQPKQVALFRAPKKNKVPKVEEEAEVKPDTSAQLPLSLGGRQADYLDKNQMRTALKAKYHLATEQQKEWGLHWYDVANEYIKNISEKTGISEQRVAGVMAAFSPRTAWDANTAAATHFLLHYDPNDPDAFTTENFPGLGDNLARSKRILQAEDDFDAILAELGTLENAPKIRSFFRNLMGDKQAVTLDTWMAKAMMGRDDILSDPEKANAALGWPGAYDHMTTALRDAAKDLGLTPRELQSIVWTQVNNTATYAPWDEKSYQKELKKRTKQWAKTPHKKPIPDYTHDVGWNAVHPETGEPLKPQPNLKGARNFAGPEGNKLAALPESEKRPEPEQTDTRKPAERLAEQQRLEEERRLAAGGKTAEETALELQSGDIGVSIEELKKLIHPGGGKVTMGGLANRFAERGERIHSVDDDGFWTERTNGSKDRFKRWDEVRVVGPAWTPEVDPLKGDKRTPIGIPAHIIGQNKSGQIIGGETLQLSATKIQNAWNSGQFPNNSDERFPLLTRQEMREEFAQARLTAEEKGWWSSVANYGGNGYITINVLLRGLRKWMPIREKRNIEQTEEHISDIDKSMTPLKSPVTVNRVVSGGTVLSKLEPGDVLVDGGFISTSVKTTTGDLQGLASGKQELKTTMEFRVPAGVKACYLDDMGEEEILLERGLTMRVAAKYTNDKGRVHFVFEVLPKVTATSDLETPRDDMKTKYSVGTRVKIGGEELQVLDADDVGVIVGKPDNPDSERVYGWESLRDVGPGWDPSHDNLSLLEKRVAIQYMPDVDEYIEKSATRKELEKKFPPGSEVTWYGANLHVRSVGDDYVLLGSGKLKYTVIVKDPENNANLKKPLPPTLTEQQMEADRERTANNLTAARDKLDATVDPQSRLEAEIEHAQAQIEYYSAHLNTPFDRIKTQLTRIEVNQEALEALKIAQPVDAGLTFPRAKERYPVGTMFISPSGIAYKVAEWEGDWSARVRLRDAKGSTLVLEWDKIGEKDFTHNAPSGPEGPKVTKMPISEDISFEQMMKDYPPGTKLMSKMDTAFTIVSYDDEKDYGEQFITIRKEQGPSKGEQTYSWDTGVFQRKGLVALIEEPEEGKHALVPTTTTYEEAQKLYPVGTKFTTNDGASDYTIKSWGGGDTHLTITDSYNQPMLVDWRSFVFQGEGLTVVPEEPVSAFLQPRPKVNFANARKGPVTRENAQVNDQIKLPNSGVVHTISYVDPDLGVQIATPVGEKEQRRMTWYTWDELGAKGFVSVNDPMSMKGMSEQDIRENMPAGTLALDYNGASVTVMGQDPNTGNILYKYTNKAHDPKEYVITTTASSVADSWKFLENGPPIKVTYPEGHTPLFTKTNAEVKSLIQDKNSVFVDNTTGEKFIITAANAPYYEIKGDKNTNTDITVSNMKTKFSITTDSAANFQESIEAKKKEALVLKPNENGDLLNYKMDDQASLSGVPKYELLKRNFGVGTSWNANMEGTRLTIVRIDEHNVYLVMTDKDGKLISEHNNTWASMSWNNYNKVTIIKPGADEGLLIANDLHKQAKKVDPEEYLSKIANYSNIDTKDMVARIGIDRAKRFVLETFPPTTEFSLRTKNSSVTYRVISHDDNDKMTLYDVKNQQTLPGISVEKVLTTGTGIEGITRPLGWKPPKKDVVNALDNFVEDDFVPKKKNPLAGESDPFAMPLVGPTSPQDKYDKILAALKVDPSWASAGDVITTDYGEEFKVLSVKNGKFIVEDENNVQSHINLSALQEDFKKKPLPQPDEGEIDYVAAAQQQKMVINTFVNVLGAANKPENLDIGKVFTLPSGGNWSVLDVNKNSGTVKLLDPNDIPHTLDLDMLNDRWEAVYGLGDFDYDSLEGHEFSSKYKVASDDDYEPSDEEFAKIDELAKQDLDGVDPGDLVAGQKVQFGNSSETYVVVQVTSNPGDKAPTVMFMNADESVPPSYLTYPPGTLTGSSTQADLDDDYTHVKLAGNVTADKPAGDTSELQEWEKELLAANAGWVSETVADAQSILDTPETEVLHPLQGGPVDANGEAINLDAVYLTSKAKSGNPHQIISINEAEGTAKVRVMGLGKIKTVKLEQLRVSDDQMFARTITPSVSAPKTIDRLPDIAKLLDASDADLHAAGLLLDGQYGGLRLEGDFSREDGVLVMSGDVFDENNNKVGRTRIELQRDSQENLTAYVDMVELVEEAKNKGFNSNFQRALDTWYRRSGVTRKTLYASLEDGGYTWAKAGYGWDPEKEQTNINKMTNTLEKVEGFVGKMPTPADEKKLLTLISKFKDPKTGKLRPYASWPPMAMLANFRDSKKKAWGKEMLYDTHWYGSTPMELSDWKVA